MSIKFKVEKTENKNELKLEFIVPAEKFEEGITKVFNKNAKFFTIPGFRKGKAPRAMVEKHYGIEMFYEDAFNEIVPEIYDAELKKNNIEAVNSPELDITQIEKGKELMFTALIQIKPEVKLGTYKGIEVEKKEYKVSADDINKELDSMAERNSRLVSIEDRAVKSGDTTIIDFKGLLNDVPFEGGTAENHELVIGSNSFIPGFEDQVIGMKLEEEKDLKVKFPDEYMSEDLAGKDVIFKVKVNEIKIKELPKIDDEFAKDVSEFENLKDLKASIKEKLVAENDKKAKFEMEEEALKEISENTKIDVPSGMIETEIDYIEKDIESKLQYQGLKLDQYLEMMGKSKIDFRKDYRDQALASVKTKMILEAVTKTEKLKADKKTIDEKVKELSEVYGQTEEQIRETEGLMNYVSRSLEDELALDFIMKNVKLVEAKAVKKETKETKGKDEKKTNKDTKK